jgi:hypothetical protein
MLTNSVPSSASTSHTPTGRFRGWPSLPTMGTLAAEDADETGDVHGGVRLLAKL